MKIVNMLALDEKEPNLTEQNKRTKHRKWNIFFPLFKTNHMGKQTDNMRQFSEHGEFFFSFNEEKLMRYVYCPPNHMNLWVIAVRGAVFSLRKKLLASIFKYSRSDIQCLACAIQFPQMLQLQWPALWRKEIFVEPAYNQRCALVTLCCGHINY